MKKIILAVAAISSVGFGPAVYALPAMSGSNCAKAQGSEELKCEYCSGDRCYNCRVTEISPDGEVTI